MSEIFKLKNLIEHIFSDLIGASKNDFIQQKKNVNNKNKASKKTKKNASNDIYKIKNRQLITKSTQLNTKLTYILEL